MSHTRDFEADYSEAMRLLADARPEVAELVETGEVGLHVIEGGVFGVDSMPATRYSVVVDVIEGEVRS